ncbi:hypothetical protein KAR91_88225 [Candidatus Pacearchaeota archaeon]|nr:hypothetical protein [Candidatus Pacearchaeota archaeon]
MLLLEQESFLKFVKIALSFGMEIVGLIFMFIEIKFPDWKGNMDKKVRESFDFYLYSSNREWGGRMKYYWSIKNFKNSKCLYEKNMFIFSWITTIIIPIVLILLYLTKFYKYLILTFDSKIINWLLILAIGNIIWFFYALVLVWAIRHFIGKIDKYFNGNVLGGLGLVFAFVGILVKFFKLLFL